MSMKHNGIPKVVEELGEALQILGKLLQYPNLQLTRDVRHPDGTILLDRLEEEMGDVIAATAFLSAKFGLNRENIQARTTTKIALFTKWDQEP